MPEITQTDFTPGKITKENLLDYYKIPETDLERLFPELEKQAQSFGLDVVLADLSQLTKVNDPKALDIKHDTCQSDGKTVYLHNDLKKAGGMPSRIYDLIHVGLGHGTQWSANKNSKLQFAGDKSWKIATKAYVGAGEENLKTVYEYEKEAGRLGLEHLKKVLAKSNRITSAGQIIQMYNDYLIRDLSYIMQYYRSGKIVDFFENFEPNQPLLEDINVPEKLQPKTRANPAIPLIRLS
jgi:hypothetical protein